MPGPSLYKSTIDHALPQGPVSGESGVPQSRGIKRSDITQERGATEDVKNKMNAYQEELRIQMEQQKAKKEEEKAKIRREEELLEREIEMQR